MAFKSLVSILQITALVQHTVGAPVFDESLIDNQAFAKISADDTVTPPGAETFSGFGTRSPIAVLRPVQAPASHELPVAQQVVPQQYLNLHFSEVASSTAPETSAAIVSIPKLTYPAINAVAAAAITNVECDGDQARVSFVDQRSYDEAAALWSSAGLFTLVTFSDSCGTGTGDSTHDFVLVHNVISHSPESLSILVTSQDIELENAVGGDTPIRVDLGSISSDNSTSLPGVNKDFSISLPTISKSITKSVSWSKYPTNAQSPWGPAYQLYSSSAISAYCVGCGADAAFSITGSIEFTIFGGLKKGSVSLDGNMNAAAVFGLVGHAGVKVPIKDIPLATVTLAGFSVPGFLTFGPFASISAGGSLTVDAAGQLEVGARLHWPKVHAAIDIVGSGSGQSGWSPTVEPVFAANGAISSTLDIHLTNTIGLGVSIPPIKFNKQVSLNDRPGVQVTAGIQGSAAFQNGQFSGGFTGSCKGIAISAHLYNNVFADIVGKTINLFTWNSAPLSRCITIGASANNQPAVVPMSTILPPPKSTLIPVVLPTSRSTVLPVVLPTSRSTVLPVVILPTTTIHTSSPHTTTSRSTTVSTSSRSSSTTSSIRSSTRSSVSSIRPSAASSTRPAATIAV